MEKNRLISKSFMWMFVGLLVTFLTGIIISFSETMLENIYGGMYWVFIIVELLLVIFLSARVMKMSATGAKVCFLLYSFVSGLTFSSIFIAYELSSIVYIFLITALVFAVMSLIGYTTKIDLTKMGTYLLFGLLAIMIVAIVNIFIGSSMLAFIISIVCVVIFLGITAYDVQKIKALENSGLPEDNLAIYGALDLYLDFINIFLHLLSIFNNDN